MSEELVNKVALSGIMSLDLSEWITSSTFTSIDLKDQLWRGLALKEKDFRSWIKEHNWESYQNQYVHVHCSADAIVPQWAFMLVASKLLGKAKLCHQGTLEEIKHLAFVELFNDMDDSDYQDARIVIKGCGDGSVPNSVYSLAVSRLQPIAKSIMFGEPCSTVPVFKKPRNKG